MQTKGIDRQNRKMAFIAIAIFPAILLIELLLVPEIQHAIFTHKKDFFADTHKLSEADSVQMNRKAENLKRAFTRLTTSENTYMVINTSENTFRLYKRNQLIGNGLCSTGSLIRLEVDSTRHWIFETPKGVFRVRNKIIDPVWHKPDWAFLEEGIQPPPPGHSSRYEKGVLGDYALDLGNGYYIHGTLYQRLIGSSVTHGCIRLKDEDLKMVYETLNVGTKVYIF